MPAKSTWTRISYALMFIGLLLVAAQSTAVVRAAEQALTVGVGGLCVFLFGVSVGIRYGNHIRYHSRYNSASGAIEAATPYAWIANKLRGSGYQVRGPEPLIHTKPHAFVRGFLTVLSILTFGLALVDLSPVFYIAAAVIAAGGGVATVMWTRTADERDTTQLDKLEE